MTSSDKGPFRTVFVERKAPLGPKNKQLVFWGKIFSDFDPASRKYEGGSLSYRHLNGCVITVAGSNLKSLTEESFVEIFDRQQDKSESVLFCKGARAPSRDALIHFLIYKERKDIQAIFFGHDELVTEKLGTLRISRTTKEEESGTEALFKRIREMLGRRKYVYVKNRGILSFGRTIKEAGERTLLVHERAMKKP